MINLINKFLFLIAIAIFIFVTIIHGIVNISSTIPKNVFSQNKIPVYGYKIITTYPHSKTSFTEGLILEQNNLYESTGRYGHSKLLKTNLNSGKVLKLKNKYFGEGIAILGNEIFQLTYKSNLGFVYDKNTFKLKRTFNYQTEGWGLTTDGKYLIMSDGSEYLYFINPVNFQITKRILVSDNQQNIKFLNALSYVDGKIYANIFKTDIIAIISAKTGIVIGWMDLSEINPKERTSYYDLNGIAYRPQTKTFLVTGKCWSKIFEIKIDF